jgi:hypothetical protein
MPDLLAQQLREFAARPGDPERLADALIRELGAERWAEVSHQIARRSIAGQIRAIKRKTPDARQLSFAGFQHVWIVEGETLDRYRARITALERRIRSYNYERRSPERLKEDKRELREMKRLEPKLAPYFAGAPDMTVDRATELYAASLETPTARRNRKGGKTGGRGRTVNQ